MIFQPTEFITKLLKGRYLEYMNYKPKMNKQKLEIG